MLRPKKQAAQRDGKLLNDIKQYYTYRNGPYLDIEFFSLGYERLFAQLLFVWLQLHDGIYLERAYGLPRVLPVPKYPYILRNDEALVRVLVEDKPGLTIKAFSTSGEYSLASATIEEDEIDFSIAGLYNWLPSRDHRVVHLTFQRYIRLKKEGYTFFVDRKVYPTRSEALEALYRLRHAEQPGRIAAAAPPEGAVAGALAEILPRAKEFGTRKVVVPSYTYTEAEARWRKICLEKVPTKAQVKELRAIANALDIETESRDPEELCTVISNQYELEYGERARIRRAMEEEIPLK